VLAVHAHERIAAHHDPAHHDPAHPQSHGPNGQHVQDEAGPHGHEAEGQGYTAEVQVDHDHHEHEVPVPSLDLALLPLPGPTGSLLSRGTASGVEVPAPGRSRVQDGYLDGVGPPAEPGSLPILHCSLLI
jgi:hypothetical protein